MKVILKKDVDNLGEAGEIVDVADGYGHNYLVPRGLAMRATKGAVKDAEAIARARKQRESRTIAEAQRQAEQLDGKPVTLTAKAGEDGQLYGSVGVSAVAQAASDQLGIPVSRKQLELERPIKSVGEYEVPVRIHRDVTATLRVDVTAAE